MKPADEKSQYRGVGVVRQPVGRSLDPVVRQLIEAYDGYLALLGEELNSLTGVAYVHGWRSSRVEEGKAWRAKIEELKFALDYEKQARLFGAIAT